MGDEREAERRTGGGMKDLPPAFNVMTAGHEAINMMDEAELVE